MNRFAKALSNVINNLKEIRGRIYSDDEGGYVSLKKFLNKKQISHIQKFWTDNNLINKFSEFIKNKDVRFGSPNYYYQKPSPTDLIYCCFTWNNPPDQFTHEVAYCIQILRNIIEGQSLYSGFEATTGKSFQYRVCNHKTNSFAVYPHSDFTNMERKDPTGDHDYDPVRLQATLLLSTPDYDYSGDGFKLTLNNGKTKSFGLSQLGAGDLILWRYNNVHSVENISVNLNQLGFLRLILPQYDIEDPNFVNDKYQTIGWHKGSKIVRIK